MPSVAHLRAATGARTATFAQCMFGAEYRSTGTFVGANRPAITKTGREFFAEVTMLDGLIVKVK